MIPFKRALIETSAEVYAVVDHHKFGQTALRTFSSLQEISGIMTDAGLSPGTVKQYEGAGVTML